MGIRNPPKQGTKQKTNKEKENLSSRAPQPLSISNSETPLKRPRASYQIDYEAQIPLLFDVLECSIDCKLPQNLASLLLPKR